MLEGALALLAAVTILIGLAARIVGGLMILLGAVIDWNKRRIITSQLNRVVRGGRAKRRK
jgi:hypothetical protein